MDLFDLPIEMIEKILLFLSPEDLSAWFIAINNRNDVSDAFWIKKSLQDGIGFNNDFIISQESVVDFYWNVVNWKLGRFEYFETELEGVIDFLNDSSLIVSHNQHYLIWKIGIDNFHLVHKIAHKFLYVHGNFIILKKSLIIYKFDKATGEYRFFMQLIYRHNMIHDDIYISGLNLLIVSEKNTNNFVIFDLEKGEELPLVCPPDVQKMLLIKEFNCNIYCLGCTISNVKIIVYNIQNKLWMQEINCLQNINVLPPIGVYFWVNSHIIVFKGMAIDNFTGIPYKVVQIHDTNGKLQHTVDLQPLPSTFIFKCFLVDDTVIMACAENTIMIHCKMKIIYFNIDKEFLDINLIPTNIFIISYKKCFRVYDLSKQIKIYEIFFSFETLKRPLFNSQFFVIKGADNKVGVYNFTKNQFGKKNVMQG